MNKKIFTKAVLTVGLAVWMMFSLKAIAFAEGENANEKTYIGGATVILGDSLTYNGSEQTQTVTKVMLDETDITSYCIVSDNVQTDAGAYVLTVSADPNSNFTGSTSKLFEISKKDVIIDNLDSQNKEYDGSKNALIKVSGTTSLQGVIDTDAAYVEAELVGFYDRNYVGDGGDITITISSGSLKGDRADNYELTVIPEIASGRITRKPIRIIGIKADNKIYDGSANAKLNFDHASINGVIDADKSKVSFDATGSFMDKSVGTGKTVTIDQPTLSGVAAGNYVVEDYTSTATAGITSKNIEIIGTTVEEKIYDGSTEATIDYVGDLEGVVSGDDISIRAGRAEFANKDVGENKLVVFAGFTLSGVDAGNYTLTAQPTAINTGKIKKNPLVIDNISANNKTYDGTNDVTFNTSSATLTGAVANDDIAITVTGYFDYVNAGDQNVTISSINLTGDDAGNYSVDPSSQTSTNATINKASKGTFTANPIDVRAGGTESGMIDLREYLKDDASKTNSDLLMSSFGIVDFWFTGDINSSIIYDCALTTDGYLNYKANSSLDGITGALILTVSSDDYTEFNISVPLTVATKTAQTFLDNSDTTATGTGVGGIHEIPDLKDFANNQTAQEVDVTLTVKPVSEATLYAGSEEEKAAVEKIKEAANDEFNGIAESDIKHDFVEIDITKSENGGPSVKVTETGSVVEMIIPYDTTERHNLSVYRFHNNTVSSFKKLDNRPNEYQDLDGCLYIDGSGKNAKMHIYSNLYSVYSIVYTEKEMLEVQYDNAVGAVEITNVLNGNKLTKPADPIRDGYTFDGWFDQSGNEFDFDSEVTSAIVLTAKWTEKQKPADNTSETNNNNHQSNESQPESSSQTSNEDETNKPASTDAEKVNTTTPAKTEKKEAKTEEKTIAHAVAKETEEKTVVIENVTPSLVRETAEKTFEIADATPSVDKEPEEKAVVVDDDKPVKLEEAKEEIKTEKVKEEVNNTEINEQNDKNSFNPWALFGILGGCAFIAVGVTIFLIIRAVSHR